MVCITRQREYQLHRENKYLKIECLLKSQARIRGWLFFISTILFFAAALTFSLIFSMEKRKKYYEEQDERSKATLAAAEKKKETYDELLSKVDEETAEKKC